jgi:hypothetical protein
MFEFRRELKRIFQPESLKDGLVASDPSLLELLELNLLMSEARAADVAAARIGAEDRPARQLEAAAIWREIARRTGDAVALRKSASAAELACAGFGRDHRPQAWAHARCEQAAAAVLGAELYGDDGLNAAADIAFAEAQVAGKQSLAAALADLGRAMIEARTAVASGDRVLALDIAARFDAPCEALDIHGKRRPIGRLMAAHARADRAEFLAACGVRLKDPHLLRVAVDGLNLTLARIDRDYEPLSWARATTLRATAKATLCDLDGEVAVVAQVVDELVSVLEHVSRDHSPMDWARAQMALAAALQMVAEVGDSTPAFDQALKCLERALSVFDAQPALLERANALYRRADCLLRRAELTGKADALDAAEAALRAELISLNPSADPVGWAVRQLNFARLYEAREALNGPNTRERRSAAVALSAALDVFAEHGLRSLSDVALRGLERLKEPPDRSGGHAVAVG